MNVFTFFRLWFGGMRDFSRSSLGSAQTTLIINCFVVFGLFLGCVQQKMIGNGVFAFILFCFGLLSLWALPGLWRQYVALEKQEKLRRLMQRGL